MNNVLKKSISGRLLIQLYNINFEGTFDRNLIKCYGTKFKRNVIKLHTIR